MDKAANTGDTMRACLCLLVLVVLFKEGHFAMSEKQIKASTKLIRNSCQPKTKVSDDLIEKMHKGVWDEDTAAKCYMHCVLTMFKALKKDGQLDLDEMMKQVPNLPTARQAPIEKSVRLCYEKVVVTDDKCDTAWNYAKCIYMDNPENYLFP